MHFEDHQRWQM